MLQLSWSAGFEHFAAAVAALPAGSPDRARLTEMVAEYGYEILGPPPVR